MVSVLLMGHVPNAVIADEAGVSRGAITHHFVLQMWAKALAPFSGNVAPE
jgi:hypothetical protein